MVEYLLSEATDARRYEACEWCERSTDPSVHLCTAMPVERLETVGVPAFIVEKIAGAVDGHPNRLPKLRTIGDLGEWRAFDLTKLRGIGILRAERILEAIRDVKFGTAGVTYAQKHDQRRRDLFKDIEAKVVQDIRERTNAE